MNQGKDTQVRTFVTRRIRSQQQGARNKTKKPLQVLEKEKKRQNKRR